MPLLYDPEIAVSALSQADPELARLIQHVGPFELELRTWVDPFQALTSSIVYQQLSGKAAATIHKRMLALFPGEEHPDPQEFIDMPEEALRSAGMSRAKVAAVKDLAAKTLDGTVPTMEHLHTLDNEAIIDRLTAVRGVGRWTVEMLLIFCLGRPDVLPITDLGVRKGFMIAFGLDEPPRPKELATYGERWQPYRSVASWYLWRANDLA